MSPSIIQKYIFKNLMNSVLVVLLALLGIDLLFYVVNELRYVGRGDYTTGLALYYVLLKLPNKIYFHFPWAALLGSILALGQLAKNSELIILQTSGISTYRITAMVLKSILVLSIFMVILGEVLAPMGEKAGERIKMTAISSGRAVQIRGGIWVRNKDTFIHIKETSYDSTLKWVTVYNFDDNLTLKSAINASTAIKTDAGWVLNNVQGTRFFKDRIEKFTKSKLQLAQLIDINILKAASIKHLERLSFTRLYKLIKVRLDNNLDVNRYLFAFWQKVFHPISAIVMVLLAAPFSFGLMRNVNLGAKMVAGIMVGFSFFLVNTLFAPMVTVVEMSPFIAAGLPTLIFFILGCFLAYRMGS